MTQPNKTKSHKATGEKAHDNTDENQSCRSDVLFKWIPIIVSMFALGISVFAIVQSGRNFKFQNRAYIMIENISKDRSFNRGKNKFTLFGYDINNFGNTPAHNINIRASVCVFDSSFTSTPLYSNHIIKNIILSPKTNIDRSYSFPIFIEKEQWDPINKGKLFYYFYGIVEYKDIWGHSHTTLFNFVEWNDTKDFEMHEKHNKIE